jgi:uncharacterized protein YfaS (alpha-2-macroglobulin family)
MRKRLVAAFAALLGLWGVMHLSAEPLAVPDQRARAQTLFNEGNFKEALTIFRSLALSPKNNEPQLANDIFQVVNCYQNLQLLHEIDGFLDAAEEVHSQNWRALKAIGTQWLNAHHYGFVVAGKYLRGNNGGGGQYVDSTPRDRARSLQLYVKALPLIEAEAVTDQNRTEIAEFYRQFGEFLLNGRWGGSAWQLQAKTDLTKLPDYDSPNYGRWGGWGVSKGAPVDAEGNPVFYIVPESFEAATNDGQRWRWAMEQVRKVDPAQARQVDRQFADFLQTQFGVQTLREGGISLPDDDANETEKEANPFAVKTLKDEETIARLATGAKRFTLPDEFNPISILKRLSDGNDTFASQALETLAQIATDRQQFQKAADYWSQVINRFENTAHRQYSLDQIVGNWGRFDHTQSKPAGTKATLDYIFRNGKRVDFTARKLKISALLDDVKKYMKSNPDQLDWNQMQIDNIGYRIVDQDQKKYVEPGEPIAWSQDLEPRPEHFDRRETIETPLDKAGAWLVEAKLRDGNISRIIVWLDDTIIVKKPIHQGHWYYVADAVTGKPIPKANVEFFGWKQEYNDNTKRHTVLTKNFAEFTDAEGQIVPDNKLMVNDYQWIAIARTPEGRMAYHGFTWAWWGHHQWDELNEYRCYGITDRPAYRPDQTVKFKFWMGYAKYDQDNKSLFADKDVPITITDPQGNEVSKQVLKSDEFGGVNGEYALPKGAMLGAYSILLNDGRTAGSVGFRCEEYKKPEFEVTVKSPDKPVMLGEKIEAQLIAKYYFGAPVTNAKVKVKVERSPHDTRWYPAARWDWLYGSGYWWFSDDATWYPGFQRWGCFRPRPWWGHWDPTPPELVVDMEAEIGPDGTLAIPIDTALAKALHGDEDHSYKITAEVTDESRRVINGTGEVLVARQPFKVFAWTHRGYYHVGDTIQADFQARTISGHPVSGPATLKLYRIAYNAEGEPEEVVAQTWDLKTDQDGHVLQKIKATAAGQYRLSLTVTDSEGHSIEGGHLFYIRGDGVDDAQFRFNDLEITSREPEYKPGDKATFQISTNLEGSTVLLFERPSNGTYKGRPRLLSLNGKTTTSELQIVKNDMPNFFVEVVTIANGRVHTSQREVIVPPEKRTINVAVKPSAENYKPGQEATVDLVLTDDSGEPIRGSVALTMYDKSLEYISGGSNVGEIKEFFWKWRRSHNASTETSAARYFEQLFKSDERPMQLLGAFGDLVEVELSSRRAGAKDMRDIKRKGGARMMSLGMGGAGGPPMAAPAMADGAIAESAAAPMAKAMNAAFDAPAGGEPAAAMQQPTVRTNFADSAFWKGDITTDDEGKATVKLTMPENLTGWKVRAWAFGAGTRVGEGTIEVVTSKNLLVRLQAPRFFVEKDEVVISANVHNYLKDKKTAKVEFSIEGGELVEMAPGTATQQIDLPHGEDVRVDMRVRVVKEGIAKITVKALTDEESDAMQMSFPVYVHGMLKTESFSGALRPNETIGKLQINVPAERRPAQTRLEIRYSPTLAGAMVDALPYLVDYPYGCTEQTLNRFLPTVITQRILQGMNLDLAAIRDKRTNLNAQEIGDDPKRAEDWKRLTKNWHHEAKNPVFDEAEVASMVKKGVMDLVAMQCSDGGWGWFSGWGEHSWPHTTATVVHGLQVATKNDIALPPGVLDNGLNWLIRYQAEQVALLQEGERHAKDPKRELECRTQADNLDALIYSVLIDGQADPVAAKAEANTAEMRRFLYRDRTKLSLYGAALFGQALHAQGEVEQRDMIIRNIDQFVVTDNENQTTYINLPDRDNYWWYWYGDTIEANAAFLKLLTRVNPQDARASGLVKYLLNNRKNASYWNSTRDTAYCIEALAEYLIASGEGQPNLSVEVWIDGEKKQSVEITPENLFSFNNKLVIEGDALTTGKHLIELKKASTKEGSASPLYYNAYLTNFTLEDDIKSAGLEVKVNRKFYKLTQRKDATELAQGSSGQAIEQKVLKYDRTELASLSEVTSGDLLEVELEIDSKNHYEYLLFEDLKAAGTEPVDVRSGYIPSAFGAYVEFRDERVCFFVRNLPRGKQSMSYRIRAEIPGRFSALPTRASAMYAPEIKANSDEMKLNIRDAK